MHKINVLIDMLPPLWWKCQVKSNMTNFNIGLNLLGKFCHVPYLMYVIKLQVCQ